jgi:branched-subunit amino acid ABC-type transport system permease component
MGISLTALSAPLHTLFGENADKIVSVSAIVSALLACVAGIGKSPLSSDSAPAEKEPKQ